KNLEQNEPSETGSLNDTKNLNPKNEIPKQETKPSPTKIRKLFLEQIKNLNINLKNKIYGQDDAIKSVMDTFMAMFYTASPIKAIFLFLGPPATGKTYLAELIGEFMGYNTKVFDMSRYQHSNQAFGLTGLEKTYTNAEPGELTSYVKDYPKAICVFDEIEKAHPNTQNVFLQIMARGKAQDQYTKEIIDFSQCIFIFTSNLCSEIYTNDEFIIKNQNDKQRLENMVIEALKREKSSAYAGGTLGEIPVFKPEFISRLTQGEIVLFRKLPFTAFVKSGEISLKEALEKFEKEYDCEVKISNLANLVKIYILSFLPNLDIRVVKTRLSKIILSILNTMLLDNEKITKINLEIKQEAIDKFNSFITEDEEANDKFLQECFKRNETIKISTKQEGKDNEITIYIEDISLEKVPKSKDFLNEEGGIIVDFPDIKFSDIAGHERAKGQLTQTLSLLKNRKNLLKYGVKPPRGILLFGPLGTGKTTLAKAFANEARLAFIATTGTEILDIKLMKQIFKRAKEYAPAIIFIDEIDAIGSRDGSEFDAIINQFLTEISGFEDKEEILIIAATNFIEKLDPAILRSGRIDIHIKIDALDVEAREYFIDNISKKIGKELNKDLLIKISAGMSGADLEKAYNQSVFQALRENKDIDGEILAEQINIVKYGEKLSGEGYDELVQSTAYHEAGHAVISHILLNKKIEQITVSPRGNALGFVAFNNENKRANLTFDEIKNEICVIFAGREAQMKFEGEAGLDNSATSDLALAMNLAYQAVAIYGMSELGYINISGRNDMFKDKIDEKVLEILNEQKKRCEELVNSHFDKIEKVALVLINKEIILEDEFLKIMENSDKI
ncbi:MAG: AAA family ATPase, partial [Campylobacter sp.]|nr:AAA family ATPase [Campylobacter sp.]